MFEDGIQIGDTRYSSLFVNTNGNITFGEGFGDYTPSDISANGLSIIAPFWADVDTRSEYDFEPDTDVSENEAYVVETGSQPIYFDLDDVGDVVTITWSNVNGYFVYDQIGDGTYIFPKNNFQLQLFDRDSGNFDIVFRYEDIEWTIGVASGRFAARAGYNLLDGTNVYELPQSGDSAAVSALPTTPGNTGVDGLWVFEVRNGEVVANESPSVSGDAYSLDEDGVLTIAAAEGLLVNDSDPEGGPLSVSLITMPEHGQLILNEDGSFVYTPDADYYGTDSFVYRASDGTLGAQGTVDFSIFATPDAPVAVDDDGLEATDGTPTAFSIAQLLANDRDPDGDLLSLVSVSDAQHGTVSISGDDVIFTPTAGYVGGASFAYTITDGSGATDVAIVDVNVTASDKTIRGTEDADDLSGTEGDDRIVGLAGNDRIGGKEGSDIIEGGAGDDRMAGGKGGDLFIFDNRGDTGRDQIVDFDGGDLVLTREKIYDGNNDGIIAFGRNRELDVSFDHDSRVQIQSASGGPITKLAYEGLLVIDDVTYYAYGLVGAQGQAAYLNALDHFG